MKRLHILSAIFLGAVLLATVISLPVLAANPLAGANTKLVAAVGGTGLQSDITVSIGTIVRAVLSLVGTIFLILTVYAGILWMTAQGAAEQIEKAQNIISAAIIGLFITMAAYAITSFVTGKLGQVNSGAGNTTSPACSSYGADQNACTNAKCSWDPSSGSCK